MTDTESSFDADTQMEPTGQETEGQSGTVSAVAEDVSPEQLQRLASQGAIFKTKPPEPPPMPEVDESAVPLSEADETAGWTAEQSRMAAGVYQKIAGLLPTEGRDYDVKIFFKDGGTSPSLSLRPMTPIGKAFIEHVYNNLASGKK